MQYQSEIGNSWVNLALKLTKRSTSFISEKWTRKIRPIVVDYVKAKTGIQSDELIELPGNKKINYHGHFEGAYEAVLAARPF